MKIIVQTRHYIYLIIYFLLIHITSRSQIISFTPHISPHILPFQKNSDILINNLSLKGNCDDGNLLTVYNCTNIAISMPFASTLQDPYQYKIDIIQYDNNTCSPLPNTSSYFVYYGNWTNGPFPNGLDLRTLNNSFGNSFYTHTGMFLIKISFKDANLNTFVKSGLINILSAVTPNLNLEIYNTYWTDPSNTYLPASQNISNPILTGALTAGFRINNSTGNVTGYNVNIDQVDNTGNLIKNIYNKTYITNNISTVAPQQLNSFCIPSSVWSPYTGINACNSSNPNYSGYTGYWGYSNGLISVGNYYKITITLYNPCSNASNYSYIYVNNGGMKLMENPDTSTKYFKDIFKANIFPNPSKDIINFNIQTEKDDYYTIQIFDLTGRLLFTPFENIFLNSGENNLQCDIRHLNPGTHLCIIRSKNGITKNHLLVVQ
ncbi:MAG: T9SS type A sorting domain-containing protein [Bacteroidota bacterium]